MSELSSLRIDGARLWQSLLEMARIGATAKGGCNRQALTDEDREGRDLFVGWCEQLGCRVSVDAIGNIFAHRAGRDDSRAPILAGSHLDTQPTGGKFDAIRVHVTVNEFGDLSEVESRKAGTVIQAVTSEAI